jgi:hypothetical protein
MSEKSEPSKVRGNPVIKRLLKKQNKHKILSDTRFQVLIIVIFCAVAGIAFLVVKSLTSSYSLWPNNPIPNTITSANNSSIELGVKFVSKDSGYVTGIRFYKDPQNTGIHIGSLWSSNGTLLARVNFTNETNSGWQTATLAQPVNIAANVIYVVSYHALNGDYSFNSSYFSHRQSHTNGPLTAFADNSIYGANGVYVNSATPKFPTKDMNGANFWVDLVFSTKRVAPPTAPAPPTILTATQDGTTIIVAWNTGISAKSIASYNIVRNGKQYAKVSSVTFTYIDSNVMAGHTYNYQIQTIDNTGAVSAKSFNTSITYNITPGPAVALSASPESITAGSSSNLTWFSTNATSCQAASPASWTSSMATYGNQPVSPLTTTTYTITCRNGWGNTNSSPVTIKVPPAVALSASPESITAGSSSNLTWFSTNATSCQAASPASWTSLTANSGNQSVSPTNTTTYAISCNGNGGITKSLPVTVKVTPAPTVSNPPQPFGNVAGSWKLVFDSEFNGSSLDTYQWSTGVDGALGITNGYDAAIEQECYDPAQVNVSEGTLNLTAIPKTEYCPPYGGTEPYASGAVTTYGHFSYTYGYAEARVWLPGTSRIADWPAFWELGQLYNVSAGEIDIVESLEGVACATFHNSGSSPSFCSSGTFAGGWHTFAADWEPGYINFYFDGANVLSVNSGITSSPMYLVLDLALSSKITSPDTAPATMKVDYVRVWQHN